MALTRQYRFVNGEVADGDQVDSEFERFRSDINNRLYKDGTVTATGDLTIEKSGPAVILGGTESSGEKFKLCEFVESSVSYLGLYWYDVGGPAWELLAKFPESPETNSCIILESDTPAIELQGTEGSYKWYRMKESAGSLYIYESSNDGGAWDTVMTLGATAVSVAGALSMDSIASADVVGDSQIKFISVGSATTTLTLTAGSTAFDTTNVFSHLPAGGAILMYFIKITGDTLANDEYCSLVPYLGVFAGSKKVGVAYVSNCTKTISWTMYALWDGTT